MSGAQHTPGPWLWVDGRLQPVIDSNSIHTILDDSGTMVYRQHPKSSDDECLANRQLIAAAPDLLDCLRAVEVLFGHLAKDSTQKTWLDNASAAIAKATGVQP